MTGFRSLSIAISITFNLTKMLSCQYHYFVPYPPRSPLPLQSLCNSSSIVVRCQNASGPDSQQLTPRGQNSKSTAFLLNKLSHGHIDQQFNPKSSELQDTVPAEEKIKLLELSLVRKRTPQFPGSIYVQSPSDPDVGSSLPSLRNLFQGNADSEDDDEEMIMRALEIRRKVTQEIFKEAMRKGKFGITYTTNLTNRLSGFMDYIMIEAASMKRLPEFSHSTFNLRAKTVIEDSKVVPLIR